MADDWQPELDELRRREAFAERLGGAERVKRQHDEGRLTIRERVATSCRKAAKPKAASKRTAHSIGTFWDSRVTYASVCYRIACVFMHIR